MSRLGCGTLAIVLALAGSAAARAGFAAELRLARECVTAELEAAEKIRALLRRADARATWLLASNIALSKAARGHCVNGQVERAMTLYDRMFRALHADETARAAEMARAEEAPAGRERAP